MRLDEQIAGLKLDWPMTHQESMILASSDFIVDSLKHYPQWWDELRTDSDFGQQLQLTQQQLADARDEEQLMQLLRYHRRRLMCKIAWQQLENRLTTEQILLKLSRLADSLILSACDWLYQYQCQMLGTPLNRQGEAQQLLVIAMGKLGGEELNFSSDIDLIFAYQDNGRTHGGRKEMDNVQFFTRLGQKLIKVLSQQTVDGFVYRVDMRLRPFGDSGPLVFSFSALEEYYQEQGRDWERYAMVKARVLGQKGKGFYALLRPFIYRRYIDFSVIQSLRNMKVAIEREVRRRGLYNNIKLGAGGIREIEFIAQVFQLIRGGREPILQNRSLLAALAAIEKLALLSEAEVARLRSHYLYLRRVENILQAIDDKQTQTLPENDLDHARLTLAMGCQSWPEFKSGLEHRMAEVREIFNSLIGDDEHEQQEESASQSYQALWLDTLTQSELAVLVPQLLPEQASELLIILTTFRQDLDKRTIGHRGRDVLDQLMPCLLALVCVRADVIAVLPRLNNLILNIVSRTTYLELLLESKAALTQLVRLCAASPMIASQLARYPILLDELLNFNEIYQLTPLTAYRDELQHYLLRIPQEDEEQQVDALRQFKQTQLLHIAAADITDRLSVVKVSEHLTSLAEAIIEQVIQQAWLSMTIRYGQPAYLAGQSGRGFAVIAYGKLGGCELGYSSDLDLVFVSDCPENTLTDGQRAIDGRQFYLRLAQRIMHLFSMRTSSGILYDVDVRLRPLGDAGLLVPSMERFADYQLTEAWMWEHQALVRARMVYGDQNLLTKFVNLRRQVLTLPRDEGQLRQEVNEMRQKMLDHHAIKAPGLFDIKTGQYGLIDIEFIAQYLVLRYAAYQPALTRYCDNAHIFETLADYQIISQQESQQLIDIYLAMRSRVHKLSLQDLNSAVPFEQFAVERDIVQQSWQRWLG